MSVPKWTAALILSVSCVALPALPARAAQRVLPFPAQSVGVVTTNDPPHREGNLLTFARNARDVRRAAGRVAVPDEGFIGLELSQQGSADLSFLDRLPPNALETLKITGAHLGKEQMRRVVRLESLVKLEFSRCAFSADAFDGLPALPELLYLNILHRDGRDEQGPAIAGWIARQPKLEAFFGRPSLSPGDLRLIGDHPTLTATTVDLGGAARETLAGLSKLPRLRWLTVIVNGEADADALDDVANLAHLEQLRWWYGRADGAVLRRIAAHNRLKRLMFFQVEPGDGFSPALESFARLTHLDLVPADGTQVEDLADRLLRMPRLRQWPILRNVDAETLKRIVATKQIESLTLERVANDVTPEHLRQLGKLKKLKRLDVRHIPVRDDWLGSLSRLEHLEYLNLWDTGVTGSGFASLHHLRNLREIRIFYSVLDDARVRPELSSMSRLPGLEILQIYGSSFRPKDVEPLQTCESLRQLRLLGGGFTDDSTAAWVSRLPNLVDLILRDNCVVTDRGARVLAQHPKLQRLRVNGFLTSAGAKELARIPTLRELTISTSNISKEETTELRRHSTGLPSLHVCPFSGSVVLGEDGALRKPSPSEDRMVRGEDGLLREFGEDEPALRARMDKLEGRPAPPLETGSKGPDSGVAWSTFRGKVVLIDFWGTWCGPCKRRFPELRDLYSRYHDKGLEIVGVHTSRGAENLDAFVKKKGVPWENIVDADDRIEKAYKVAYLPVVFSRRPKRRAASRPGTSRWA